MKGEGTQAVNSEGQEWTYLILNYTDANNW